MSGYQRTNGKRTTNTQVNECVTAMQAWFRPRCAVIVAVITFITCLTTSELRAQFTDTTIVKATWLHRLPDLDIWRSRNKGGFGNWLVADTLRNRILYFGGADQCFWTTKPDSLWTPIYNLEWDVTPINLFWIDMRGNYIFTGETTHWYYRTTISTDGGDTWRIYEPDSSLFRALGVEWDFFDRTEVMVTEAGGLPVWDYSCRYRAVVYSLDDGLTYDSILMPESYLRTKTQSGYKSWPQTTPEPFYSAWYGPDSVWREYDLRTKDVTIHRNWPQIQHYRRLEDGTIVAAHGGVIRIRTSDGRWSDWPIHQVRASRARKNASLREIIRFSDTTVYVVYEGGHVFRYDVGQTEPQTVLSVEPRSGDEAFEDVGIFGDILAFAVVRQSGRLDETTTYGFLNMRTAEIDTHTTRGSRSTTWKMMYHHKLVMGPSFLAMPNKTVVRLQPQILGEVSYSLNNGRNWFHVQRVDRTARVPYEYHDVHTVKSLKDGRILARVVDQRIIVQPPSRDTVWPIIFWEASPFRHPASHPNFRNNSGQITYGRPEVYLDEDDHLVACGDVMTRWDLSGNFLDTLLDKRSSFFAVSEFSKLYAAGADTLWLSFNKGEEWQAVNLGMPMGMDTIRATVSSFLELPNGDLLIGLRGLWKQKGVEDIRDSCIGGIWRSTDRGDTWELATGDLRYDTYVTTMFRNPRTGTLYAAASQMVDEGEFYNSLFRPYPGAKDNYVQHSWRMYRSTDDGYTWVPTFSRGGLGDDFALTLAHAFGPYGDINVAVPRTQYLRSFDDGVSWIVPYTIGLDTAYLTSMTNTSDGRLVFGTTKGIADVDLTVTSVNDDHTSSYQLLAQRNGDGINITMPMSGAWNVHVTDLLGRTVTTASFDNSSTTHIQLPATAQGLLAVTAYGPTFSISTVVSP